MSTDEQNTLKGQKNQVLKMTIPTLSCLAVSNNTSLFIFLVEWLTKRYNQKYMALIRTWFKFYLFQQFLSFVNCVCPIFCTIKCIIVRPCTISFSSNEWNITGNLDTYTQRNVYTHLTDTINFQNESHKLMTHSRKMKNDYTLQINKLFRHI